MSTKHKLLHLLRNPLVIVPPLVLILAIGWQQYTYAGRDFSLPDPALNLLTNSDFSAFAANGLPAGWQLAKSGTLQYTADQTSGYATGSSLQLTVSAYQSGDTTLESPKVNTTAGKTYLFKTYYRASAPFALLLRSYFNDGSSTTELVRTYPATGSGWTTASDAFPAAANLQAVQVVFRAYHNGSLTLNAPYLEPQQQVYIAPAPTGANTLPNSGRLITTGAYDAPDYWSTYQAGSNTVAFAYVQDPGGAYVQTAVSDYRNGQAKWQYTPQPVAAGQYYSASLAYRSDAPASVVAEYVLQNGSREDQTVATLPPADNWTTAAAKFEVPPQAVSMFISVPLQRNGTVATRNYTLLNITKPGAAEWRQPLVSITFDGGLQSPYDNALPILHTYGYTATFYVNPPAIETDGFMTANELDALAGSGNEIGAHGYDNNDLTAINTTALDYQLREGRDYLRKAGFTVNDVSTPYGRSDSQVQYYAQQYYTLVRGTEPGINTRQNLNPYNLKVFYVTKTTTPAALTSALQAAKAENGWLVLVYHQVENASASPQNTDQTTITAAAFQEQMDQLHGSSIRVLPVANAYSTLEGQP
jgi:peptidoglycan/xylan/chitin deacetylase (PgdA/CDA1 family)